MPSSLHIRSTSTPHASLSRARSAIPPGGVDLGTERGEHAHPPVADLVTEALHYHGAVVGHDSGGLGLVVEVSEQVGSGGLVEAASVPQPGLDHFGVAR